LTSITRRQSSSVIFSTVRSTVIPALLTRMSSRPCCSITSEIVRRQSSADPMSPRCTEVLLSGKLSRNCWVNLSAASWLPL
jgi:hypothetical protein